MATRSLGSLTLDLVAKTGGFEQGMDRASRSMQRFKTETTKQQNDLEKLLGKIDPVVGRLGELDKMEQQLAAHRKANRLPADDYAEYLGKLNAMRDGLTKTTAANDTYTMSAKAQAAALRGVPAQFTDIVTSLQGGQQPLTVFLQQGGQLKDMFGGAAPAARALGGYIAGLVNPFTIAAAAAGLLAVAYNQGSAEQDVFRVSLISTGNLAGKSTGQLADLAKEVSGVTGTTGAAADALAQLVATGSLTSDQFKDMAIAAVAWESATGKAVADTVAEFKRLADEPTKASAALNEQYNYLTAAIYQQIQALEEQGNKTAAANLAEATYAGALQERAKDIKENLGTLEAAWKGITSTAKSAWDAMLDIGRESSLQEEIAKLTTFIQKRDELGGYDNTAYQAKLDLLIKQRDAATAQAKAQGDQSLTERNATAALTTLHQSYLANLDKESKKKLEIQKLDKARADALKGPGVDTAAIEREYAAARAGLEDKYKEKKTPRAKAFTDDAATRLLLASKEQQAALEAQLATTQKMGPAQRQLVEFEQQIADLKTKKTLTADQQSLLTNQKTLETQLQQAAAVEKQVAQKEQMQKLTERAAQLEESIANSLRSQQEQYGRQLDGAGMGDQYRERLNQQKSIYREYQRYQEQLDKATPKDQLGSDAYKDASAKIQEGLQTALESQQDYYAQLDQLNQDWTVGARDAWSNYLADTNNVAKQTQDLLSNAFKGAEDAIVTFVKTGKLSMSELADSIISDLIRIQARQMIVASLSAAGGGWGAAFAGLFSATQAQGGAWSKGVQMFADGGAFTNQVVSKPTAFGHAGGLGLMGEAGPEAIVPLTRTADGSLGVKALTGGSSGGGAAIPTSPAGQTIQQSIVVQGSADESTLARIQQAARQGAEMGYQAMLKDFQRNGPARQMLRKGS